MLLMGALELPEDAAQARALQARLASRVRLTPLVEPERIAGCDVCYRDEDGLAWAVVVVMVAGIVVEQAAWVGRPAMPYQPGLFAFREASALILAFERLITPPDLVFVDGHGIAHPRRFGLACHLGLLLGVPTVGVAKSRLVGEFEEVGAERGCSSPLMDGQHTIGSVLRTRRGSTPVFVSPGHLCDSPSAVGLTLAASGDHRLPAPIRVADQVGRQLSRG